MKRCSVLLVIMELQIKTTMRCHFTLINLANIKKLDYSKCHIFLGKMQNDTAL